jgi:hypothetical protein
MLGNVAIGENLLTPACARLGSRLVYIGLAISHLPYLFCRIIEQSF